jgi:hypothetical protein
LKPEGLRGQVRVDLHGGGAHPGLEERLRREEVLGLVGLGAPLEGQVGRRVGRAIRVLRRGRVERRHGTLRQHGQDRQRLEERRQRRQRAGAVVRKALVGEHEPASDAAGRQQPHLQEIATREAGLHQLLSLGERAQRTPIGGVAQQ